MNPPLFASQKASGFPSPADDFVEDSLDLNRFLIKRPAATFYTRVSGDSMMADGILDGDYLIVDRSLEVFNNAVVVAAVNGELIVRKYCQDKDGVWLVAANADYPPLLIQDDMEFQLWGVVRSVFRKTV
ncbi:MAG: translesion error-prone DNA polymerase V autoproteolytic subunit [Cyanobacteria bacterium J06559_3]